MQPQDMLSRGPRTYPPHEPGEPAVDRVGYVYNSERVYMGHVPSRAFRTGVSTRDRDRYSALAVFYLPAAPRHVGWLNIIDEQP